MIVSLVIAWCLLSVPFGIVMGMCIRQGVHGAAAARRTAGAAVPQLTPVLARAAQDVPAVPEQRRPPVRSAALQDVS